MMKRLVWLLPFFVHGCGGSSQPAAAPTPPSGSIDVPASAPATAPEPVRATVWLSTYDGSQRLAKQQAIEFSQQSASAPDAITIDIDETRTFQTMAGFGAALTESSAWLIGTRLSPEQRDTLMTRLFDEHEGIGLSQMRHGIGATDFSLKSYTYSDASSEEHTTNAPPPFTIEAERSYVLPLMKQALSLNPDLRIMGTPWSAPAWMKANGALNGGALRPEMYAAFANYLVDYLRAFAEEGVPIDSMTVQNEPLHESPSYPSMRMEAHEQADFIGNHLGPALLQADLDTRVFVFDHNWDRPEFPIQVLDHAGARQFAAGTAFHCYAGDVSAQSRVYELHPDKEIRLTECTGSMGSDFGSDMHWWMRNLFIGGMRNWASAVLMWNLALDESSGPHNGGCTNCRGVVTIDQATGNVTYNGEYYALGHASLAARPGASRIESSHSDGAIDSVAFLNPDGSKGLLLLNQRSEPTPVTIRWQGQSANYDLPAQAVVTLRWP